MDFFLDQPCSFLLIDNGFFLDRPRNIFYRPCIFFKFSKKVLKTVYKKVFKKFLKN